MENIEVMVILFIIVVLGYTLCKLGDAREGRIQHQES